MLRFIILMAVVAVGCADNTNNDEIGTNDANDGYVADLAWRYLELEIDSDGSAGINDEVTSLSPDEMRAFTKQLQILGGADEIESAIMNEITEVAIESGEPFFSLTDEALAQVLDDVYSDEYDDTIVPVSTCWPWESICPLWSHSSTTSLYAYNSSASGTTASWSDRRSTEQCETGGCDHRFRFSGTKTLIDGKTTAYDNWIASYSSIVGEHAGSSTYAVMGNVRALAAGIVWVEASKVKAF